MSLCLRTRGPFGVEEAREKACCSMAGCAYLGVCSPFSNLAKCMAGQQLAFAYREHELHFL